MSVDFVSAAGLKRVLHEHWLEPGILTFHTLSIIRNLLNIKTI